MKEKMEYYLGLDMGTNSVGWAVTDKEYRLMRAKEKICGEFVCSNVLIQLKNGGHIGLTEEDVSGK